MASILERNGKYFIMVSTGYDSSGKQLRKTMTYKPEEGLSQKQIEKELQEQVMLFERKVLNGQILNGSVTFMEFTERWMRDYALKQLSPKTIIGYEYMLRRMLPEIGNIRLDKLKPHHLMAVYANLGQDVNHKGLTFIAKDELLKYFDKKKLTRESTADKTELCTNTIYNMFKKQAVAEQTANKICGYFNIDFNKHFEPSKPIIGLSNKTIKHHHRLVSAILNQAVYWQVIPENVAKRVMPPKVARTEAKYLDEKQTAKLIELLINEPHQYRTMILLFIYSGLRRGELCGLEWKDIDFENNMITVRRSSQYVSGKGIFEKETKTETSDRTIKLPTVAFEVLREHKLWQLEERLKVGNAWEENDRLFTQWNGIPIHPDTITGWFSGFIAKTDLPKISIHSLRHTNITLMIAAGVPLRTVSYRAGHAQTSTTANIYSHALRTADEMAADVIENMLKISSIKQKQA